ncbi:MAG TPA: hypothetical protein PLA05_00765 [bacterium]|nr:MAG: hypothetical protein BWX82_00201 [Parcubacteria group bacterium ADurb.Bin115]HNU81364.1 hypothetical protein [bacterium]HPW05486.1 hypothetical protein [bacterium]
MSKQEKNNQVAEEKKKRFFLKVGVWVFSVLILSFWLFTLVHSFNNTTISVGQTIDADTAAWQADLNQTIDIIRNEMVDKTSVASNTPAVSQDFLEKMNANLEEQVAASETAPIVEENITDKSRATITPEELISGLQKRLPELASSSCPEFIDCMPSIGEAKPCVIPPGCENITQIAY